MHAPDVSNTHAAARIRHAGLDDIPALVALVASAYRGDASRRGWTSEADLIDGQRVDAAMLRADLARRDSVILIAERDGMALACAQVALEATGDGMRTAGFGLFAVRPDAQRGGLGHRMLAQAERTARDVLACARMRMGVIDLRTELVAFYRRRGYARTGRFVPFPYDDPRHGVPLRAGLRFEVLEKSLAEPASGDSPGRACVDGADSVDGVPMIGMPAGDMPVDCMPVDHMPVDCMPDDRMPIAALPDGAHATRTPPAPRPEPPP